MGRPEEVRKQIGDSVSATKARNYTGLPDKKACSACRSWLPQDEFTVTKRPLRDGTHRLHLSSRCKRCANASVQSLRQKKSPEALFAENRRYYQSRKRRMRSQTNRHLPIGPFREWLQAYPFSLERLARAAGMDDSTLVKLRDDTNRVGVREDTVDRALMLSDDGVTLYDLYPEGN